MAPSPPGEPVLAGPAGHTPLVEYRPTSRLRTFYLRLGGGEDVPRGAAAHRVNPTDSVQMRSVYCPSAKKNHPESGAAVNRRGVAHRVDRQTQSGLEVDPRLVSDRAPGEGDVGLRVADVAGPRPFVNPAHAPAEHAFNGVNQIKQSVPLAGTDVQHRFVCR